MSMPTTQAFQADTRRRQLLLYLLIASLPFSDFLQVGIVAFNATPVMGELAASPEEYSLVATLYAVVAIGMISMHRWLVERLGWRRFVQVSGVLFALGALVCGFSGSLTSFALGRILMATGCASFLTSGRLLVNHIPPSPQRFTGIKFLAAGLAWGGVAGPLLASMALSSESWRAAFLAMLVPALLIIVLSSFALSDELPTREIRSQSHPTGLFVLMGGSFLLLYVLQRSGFDFFSDPTTLYAGLALSLPALWLFVHLNGRRARPLIGFHRLARRRYLLGLGIFGVCYVVLGANNTMLPVLLQRTLDLPLEVVGRYLGMGALASVASWIVLARLMPRYPGPTRYYIAGFGALLLCGYQLSGLSESANPMQSVVPALLCNGVFVITVLSATAMQTFQTLPQDDSTFSHANQVKNMLAQFGLAAGMALATLCLQWRSSLHFTRLSESLSPWNPALQQTLEQLTRYFATTHDAVSAPRLAATHVGLWVAQEATLMGVLDYFFAVFLLASACLALVVLERVLRCTSAWWRAGSR